MKKLAAAVLMLLSGCGERDEPLPNGYRFVELSRGNGAITKDGAFAVYPNIVEHQVRGRLIIGKRILAHDNTDGTAPFTTGLGYFVLDTSTGHLLQGLSTASSANGS